MIHQLQGIATCHTQGPGNYLICLLRQKNLATIFAMKTNQVKDHFQLKTETEKTIF